VIKEFRTFALHGSLLDMAIGFIMGAAFSQVVSALVKDILMPPVGLILGHVDFSGLYVNLGHTPYATLADAQKAGAPVIAYGDFLNGVISFLIVAIVMFAIVRQVNRMRPPAPAPAPTKECAYCLSTIPLGATRCPHCTSELAAS
jgi:large conductance mechanosensitive channel